MAITSSELQYEDIKVSDGPVVTVGQTVNVHYIIALSMENLKNRIVLESSFDRNEPVSFKVGAGEAIKGIDEGVVGMRVGSVRRIIIPSDMAFGKKGVPGIIPPNATLFFEINLRFLV